ADARGEAPHGRTGRRTPAPGRPAARRRGTEGRARAIDRRQGPTAGPRGREITLLSPLPEPAARPGRDARVDDGTAPAPRGRPWGRRRRRPVAAAAGVSVSGN